MARNRITLEFDGVDELMKRLDEAGGSDAMKKATESALKATKAAINPKINTAMATSNLPAGGKYSTGETKSSIDNDMNVEWSGHKAAIKVGFVLKNGGIRSIFLMYGTPRMKPVPGLKDAIYGNRTRKEAADIQAEAVNKVLQRIIGG